MSRLRWISDTEGALDYDRAKKLFVLVAAALAFVAAFVASLFLAFKKDDTSILLWLGGAALVPVTVGVAASAFGQASGKAGTTQVLAGQIPGRRVNDSNEQPIPEAKP
ncbi:MAG TPA: hypothetical protein VK681_38980 [Reyranella sp.]|nr:hypothetical protein [Reyranella sp.]